MVLEAVLGQHSKEETMKPNVAVGQVRGSKEALMAPDS